MSPHTRPRAWVPAAAYFLLAIAWSWPLPLYLTTRYTHDPGDPLLVTYLLWWNAQAVPFTQAWWNAPFFWPATDTLALTEHLAGLSPISTPIQLLGGSPLLAYNIILILSAWWCGVATHALVKRLTQSEIAAYCGGIAFAYAPYRIAHFGHLHIFASWWLPLMMLALHAYYDDRRPRWLAVFGISWLLQTLTNGYMLFFIPVLVGGWLLWFTPWREGIRRPAAIVAAWAVFSLPLIPVLLEYHQVQSRLGLTRTRAEMVYYSANWRGFFSAAPQLLFWPSKDPTTAEAYVFPGLTVIVVIGAGILLRLRTRLFLFYCVAALVTARLCAGPTPGGAGLATLWHPYDWIVWLPGYNGIRVPARFFLLTSLCLAIAAAVALARILPRLGRGRTVVLTLVFGGLAVDGTIAGMPLGVPPGNFASLEPGGRVIELPFDDVYIHVRAMYRSMFHRMPVANGYAGYIPPSADVIDWALRRRDPSILTELARGHPLYVVVNTSKDAPSWTAWMDGQNGAEFLGVSGEGRVYRLPAAPYAPQIRFGAALATASVVAQDGWLVADLAEPLTVRGVELRVRGDLVRLPAMLQVECSEDGRAWTRAGQWAPGSPALVAALEDPRVTPIRLVVPDLPARYVRINAGRFRGDALTVFGR